MEGVRDGFGYGGMACAWWDWGEGVGGETLGCGAMRWDDGIRVAMRCDAVDWVRWFVSGEWCTVYEGRMGGGSAEERYMLFWAK